LTLYWEKWIDSLASAISLSFFGFYSSERKYPVNWAKSHKTS
jgi:hypothetical protein